MIPRVYPGGRAAKISKRMTLHPTLKDCHRLYYRPPPLPTAQQNDTIVYNIAARKPAVEQSSSVPLLNASPLAAAEVQKLLARLEPLKMAPPVSVNVPAKPVPPPRGKEVLSPFPPPPATLRAPSAPAVTPLTVTEFSPSCGPIHGSTKQLTVAFSQAMVPLSTVSEVETHQQNIVKLVPQPRGKWRWLDTRTLIFQPDKRFPLATKYTATVAGGTKSAVGGKLESAVSWGFSTTEPKLIDLNPKKDTQYAESLQPNIIAMFNQHIQSAQAISKIQLKVTGPGLSGKTIFPVRLLSAAEIKADKYIGSIVNNAKDFHGYLAFRPERPFPRGAKVEVTFGKGITSVSGPVPTQQSFTESFQVYDHLRLDNTSAELGVTDIIPIQFNNPLSTRAFKPSMVQITPPIPKATIVSSGGYIQISGHKQIGATYRFTISPDLRDVYGQRLGQSKTFTCKVRGFTPSIYTGGYNGDAYHIPVTQKTLPVYTINYPTLIVSAYKLGVGDSSYYEDLDRRKPDYTKTITLKKSPEMPVETLIDLRTILPDGFGNVILSVEPAPQKGPKEERSRLTMRVRCTNLAVRQISDDSHLRVFVTTLDTGRPVAGASVVVGDYKTATDVHGVATLPLPKAEGKAIVVKSGKDSIEQDFGQVASTQDYENRCYTFTDRGAYRPGEEVFVKGCLRRIALRPLADIEKPEAGVKEISVSAIASADGRELYSGTAKVDEHGAFSYSFKLPADAPTGNIEVRSAEGSSTVTIQEYRRPEFTVALADEHPEKPHFMSAPATVAVSANYFSGGSLGGATVDWFVQASPATFTPAGWSEYTFGVANAPGFSVERRTSALTDASGANVLAIDLQKEDSPQSVRFSVSADVKDINRQSFSSNTNVVVHPSKRFVGLKLDRSFVKSGEDVLLGAVCTDVDGKLATGTIKLQTLRRQWDEAKSEFVEVRVEERELMCADAPPSVPLKIADAGSYVLRATVVDSDGKPNTTQVNLQVYSAGEAVWVPPGDNRDAGVELSLDKKEYKEGETARIAVKAPFKHAEGLLVLSRRGIISTQSLVVKNGIALIEVPIKESFVPSLNADVYLVQRRENMQNVAGRWWTEHGAATITIPVPPLARQLQVAAKPEIAELEPGARNSVKVTVEDADKKRVAGSQVCVAVVDESVLALTGYAMPEPIAAFYSGITREITQGDSSDEVNYPVDLVELKKNAFESLTARYYGVPTEAASSLPPPSLPPPPLAMPVSGGVNIPRPRSIAAPSPALKLADEAPSRRKSKTRGGEEEQFAAALPPPPLPAGPVDDNAGAPQPVAVAVRKNFNPLALFAASAITGSDGTVTVPFSMPDNLTRYRIMVFALSGVKQFGIGESTVTARLPLSLRQSPPRFLSVGDKCEISFVLQNQTESSQDVSVAIRGTAGDLINGLGKQVKLGPAERGEVRFPVQADNPGTALFQSVAASGTFADSQEFSFPVYTPATTETFAAYGSVGESEAVINQPLKPPVDVFTQLGGLEVTTSSTAMQELTDALEYLHRYEFLCSEQLSSRIIALSSMRDVLVAFNVSKHSAADIDSVVNNCIEQLVSRQEGEGGFGFWRSGDHEYPYVNVYASHALAVAAKKGRSVDPAVLDRCKIVLRRVAHDPLKDYDATNRAVLQAYAVYVLSLLGEHDMKSVKRILDLAPVDRHSPETLAWLSMSLKNDQPESATIRQTLKNKITQTASTANCKWSAGYYDYLLFQSEVRTSSVVLAALMSAEPNSELVPKMVKGLLQKRQRGYWGNTQENAMACLAIDQYFRTYEKATPDFTARVWLGDTYFGEEKFKGRSMETHKLSVPTASLYRHWEKEEPLLLSKSGPGRLYYRLGLTYSPRQFQQKPLDNGFDVKRSYQGVDNASDVRKDENGVWHIKAGAMVRVKLSMSNTSIRHHVALVDPLPAGFEPVNPELSGSRTIGEATGEERANWYNMYWFDHTNLRDNRAEVFSSYLYDGTHDYSYLARATSYGTFIAAPPRAEEMYEPETFGRGATDRVIVE